VAARFLLIPTFRDEDSLDGLERMADKVARIRGDGLNPDLELLGVAMLNVSARSSSRSSASPFQAGS
jgi:cellulose biosynthesis protein BcsQ